MLPGVCPEGESPDTPFMPDPVFLAAGTGLLACFGGQHENAGADDGADTQHGQLQGAQLTFERLLFRGLQDEI